MKTKVVNIGNWNMDLTGAVNVAHGLTLADIRAVQASIINDAGLVHYPLNYANGIATVGGSISWDGTNVILTRFGTGFFDSIDFDTAVFNRGTVTIFYV